MDNVPAPSALPVADRTSLQEEETARENGTEEMFEEIMAEIFQK